MSETSLHVFNSCASAYDRNLWNLFVYIYIRIKFNIYIYISICMFHFRKYSLSFSKNSTLIVIRLYYFLILKRNIYKENFEKELTNKSFLVFIKIFMIKIIKRKRLFCTIFLLFSLLQYNLTVCIFIKPNINLLYLYFISSF